MVGCTPRQPKATRISLMYCRYSSLYIFPAVCRAVQIRSMGSIYLSLVGWGEIGWFIDNKGHVPTPWLAGTPTPTSAVQVRPDPRTHTGVDPGVLVGVLPNNPRNPGTTGLLIVFLILLRQPSVRGAPNEPYCTIYDRAATMSPP